jgi:LDH2 family malate/lactate/ureidoglycolate dehydrogenase
MAIRRDLQANAAQNPSLTNPGTGPQHTVAAAQSLNEAFQRAHKAGMAALKAGDYNGFGEAVEFERALIDEELGTVDASLSPEDVTPGQNTK